VASDEWREKDEKDLTQRTRGRRPSCKDVLNHARPLSKKNDRVGIEKRVDDLKPFVNCIRKYLLVVSGVAIDVAAFKRQPSHLFQRLGNNPCYAAFATEMLQIIDFCSKEDKISLICDEDEETATEFYRLYRRVKKVWPAAKDKLIGITFATDMYLLALQAADLVASLIRLEAGRKMLALSYDYEALFQDLTLTKAKPGERIWQAETSSVDEGTLIQLATDLMKDRSEG
jgi:hypothetical protein